MCLVKCTFRQLAVMSLLIDVLCISRSTIDSEYERYLFLIMSKYIPLLNPKINIWFNVKISRAFTQTYSKSFDYHFFLFRNFLNGFGKERMRHIVTTLQAINLNHYGYALRTCREMTR